MKLIFSVLAFANVASGECPGEFSLTGKCELASVSEAADCDLKTQLGLADDAALEERVIEVCASAIEDNLRDWNYVTFQGDNPNNYQWDNNYFDGGTRWNDAKETATEILHSGDTGSILRTYNDYASSAIIGWPDYGSESYYTDNFKNCDLRAAMCCFIDTRLTTPLNPNSDVCNHDLHNSKTSNHINRGYALFEERANKAYCNAISWEKDEDAMSARYAGNALFYISMYSGLYEHGYVENIPSSPLCACIEQMATVSETDCTKVDAVEEYTFSLNGTDLSAILISDVSYSACDTSFIEHYRSMADEEEVEELESDHIVGSCEDANEDFMNNKFYVEGSRPDYVDESKWATVFGQGYMYYPPIKESTLREYLDESPNHIIRRKCLWCTDSHKDIYYKRLTELPPPEKLDLLDLFMNNWYSSPDNVLGTDFELYSSYEDALSRTGNWTYCNYNQEQIGFPRECGPTGRVSNNWNSNVRSSRPWQTRHYSFYVEKSVASLE
jgi:hypothetical protein